MDSTELRATGRVRRFKKRLISAAVICVLILGILAFAWFSGRGQERKRAEEEIQKLSDTIDEQNRRINELIEEPIVVNPVSPEINLDILYSEIREIGELATIEYLFTDATRFTDSKQIKAWNIPFTEKSFVLKWDGVIKAGVDLDEVSIDVDKEKKTISVTLPKAKILSYEIDKDSVEVVDEKNNILNTITIEDKVKFDAATEDAMIERALENGLLEKAQKNAESSITNLLTVYPAIGIDYQIEFFVLDK